MIKQFLAMVFAGVIGSVCTWAIISNVSISSAGVESTANYAQKVSIVNQSPRALNLVPQDFTLAAAKANPAVVHIKTTAKRSNATAYNPFSLFFGEDFGGMSPFSPASGSGSGVIYSNNGYIITNNHVVEGADKLEVTLYDERTFAGTIVGTYPEFDIAVVKIVAEDLPVMELADSDQAKVGEWVLAVGNPFDLTSTVTAGIISAKGRNLDVNKRKPVMASFIQTDAAVNPGNSGGALVDGSGRLLGINTAISTHTGVFEGYSFAIPINTAKEIADEIILKGGSIKKGFLGIEVADLEADDVNLFKLQNTDGALVVVVKEAGAAQYAGVLPDDVIVQVDKVPTPNAQKVIEKLKNKKAGDQVELTIVRKGKTQDIPVTLK